MTNVRRAVIVFMVLGTAALETRQLESARGEAEGPTETAAFTEGCFWCLKPAFDTLDAEQERLAPAWKKLLEESGRF